MYRRLPVAMRFMLRLWLLIVGIFILPWYVSLYLPKPDNLGLSVVYFILGGVIAVPFAIAYFIL